MLKPSDNSPVRPEGKESLPTPSQVHDVLRQKYTKEEIEQAIRGIDLILSAVDTVMATHKPNPTFTEQGERLRA